MNTSRERIRQRVAEIGPAFRELSLSLHAEPEVGLEEVRSAAKVARALEAHGFTVERGVGGMPTALRARKSPAGAARLRFAFPAEYDALPGLGHACGHNLIAASSVAAAIGLAASADDLGIEVLVIGTPDEENTGGKAPLIEAGVFDGIDAAMMVHPGERTQTRRLHRGAWEMEAVFHGRAAHAVASPEDGINALDACVAFYRDLQKAMIYLDAGCLAETGDGMACPCIITEGGERPNIVPARAVAHFSLRSPSGAWMERGRAEIDRVAQEAAKSVGATVTINTVGNIYREIRIDPELIELFEAELAKAGIDYENTVITNCGSTDIGNLSQIMPAIHPTIDISADGNLAGHTPEFAEACAGELAHERMLKAAEIMALTAAEWCARRAGVEMGD